MKRILGLFNTRCYHGIFDTEIMTIMNKGFSILLLIIFNCVALFNAFRFWIKKSIIIEARV